MVFIPTRKTWTLGVSKNINIEVYTREDYPSYLRHSLVPRTSRISSRNRIFLRKITLPKFQRMVLRYVMVLKDNCREVNYY